MPSLTPFANVDRRTAALQAVLLSATFLGLLASAPVWANTRAFPLAPIGPWMPLLPAPVDTLLWVSMLIALIAAGWMYRQAVPVFLAAGLIAFAQDQNRGQPWFYMYSVMLLMTLGRGTIALAACRLAMTAIYLWSGIQKCNGRYFDVSPDWFAAPAIEWGTPGFLVHLLRWSVMAAPFIEIAIGIAVWIPRARIGALVVATALHVIALLMLGPLGHNYNWVVWPWNLAMIALMWVLFTRDRCWTRNAPTPPSNRKQTPTSSTAPPGLNLAGNLRALAASKPVFLLVALYAVLPVLSYSGRWDSDFSFSLYSENQAVANVFVTEAFRDRLPEPLRVYIQPFSENYDPQRQGPLTFAFQAWCYEELHVPPIPEPRNYRAVYHHLRQWAPTPADLRMIIGTRGGPVIFLQGDSEEHLQPSR